MSNSKWRLWLLCALTGLCLSTQGWGDEDRTQAEGSLDREIVVAWDGVSLVQMALDAGCLCGARMVVVLGKEDVGIHPKRVGSLIYRGTGRKVFGEIAKRFPGYDVRFFRDDVVVLLSTNTAQSDRLQRVFRMSQEGGRTFKGHERAAFESAVREQCVRGGVRAEAGLRLPRGIRDGSLSFTGATNQSRNVIGSSGAALPGGEGSVIDGLAALLQSVCGGAVVMSWGSGVSGGLDEDTSPEKSLDYSVVGSANYRHLSEEELLGLLAVGEYGRADADVESEIVRRGSASLVTLVGLALERELNYRQTVALAHVLERVENRYTDLAIRFSTSYALGKTSCFSHVDILFANLDVDGMVEYIDVNVIKSDRDRQWKDGVGAFVSGAERRGLAADLQSRWLKVLGCEDIGVAARARLIEKAERALLAGGSDADPAGQIAKSLASLKKITAEMPEEIRQWKARKAEVKAFFGVRAQRDLDSILNRRGAERGPQAYK